MPSSLLSHHPRSRNALNGYQLHLLYRSPHLSFCWWLYILLTPSTSHFINKEDIITVNTSMFSDHLCSLSECYLDSCHAIYAESFGPMRLPCLIHSLSFLRSSPFFMHMLIRSSDSLHNPDVNSILNLRCHPWTPFACQCFIYSFFF